MNITPVIEDGIEELMRECRRVQASPTQYTTMRMNEKSTGQQVLLVIAPTTESAEMLGLLLAAIHKRYGADIDPRSTGDLVME